MKQLTQVLSISLLIGLLASCKGKMFISAPVTDNRSTQTSAPPEESPAPEIQVEAVEVPMPISDLPDGIFYDNLVLTFSKPESEIPIKEIRYAIDSNTLNCVDQGIVGVSNFWCLITS